MIEPIVGRLRGFLAAGTPVAYVEVARALGSTPREAGAAMLVTAAEIHGTVGGGRMEFDAIARARALLASGERAASLDIPLGPSIGQCCGGRVWLAITRADTTLLARLDAERAAQQAARPAVLLFGAGHVGRALAVTMAPLPLAVRWIDSRAEAFGPDIPDGIAAIVSTDWQGEVAQAPAGAACLVLTHSHALDSLIVAAALERDDFCHVGLIGSITKRRQFERAFRAMGISETRLARLVCPIGAAVRDKRPAVIAAFAAAEALRAVLLWQAAQESREAPLAVNAAR